jgi:hypothetical protein
VRRTPVKRSSIANAILGAAILMPATLGTGCTEWLAVPPTQHTSHAACVPSDVALATAIGQRGVVRVAVGRVVTLGVVEAEAYASSPDGQALPAAFPWMPGASSDPAGLAPSTVCTRPPVVMSLPSHYYPFRAIHPGRYTITARLDPAYRLPGFRPPLRPLRPVRVTVVVRNSASAQRSPAGSYAVVASVLYLSRVGRPMACNALLTSFPPSGCSGVPVAGYDFQHVRGLVRFHGMGWQTPLLRLIGTWEGRTLWVTRSTLARTPEPPPTPPATCHGGTSTARAFVKRISQDAASFSVLQATPCGQRVWALVAVADRATVRFIQQEFGQRIIVAGWLRRPG